MKKRVSMLLLATGLFIAGATLTAKAGDEKAEAKKESSACTKSAASCCSKKSEDKKTEAKKETKSESKSSETAKK